MVPNSLTWTCTLRGATWLQVQAELLNPKLLSLTLAWRQGVQRSSDRRKLVRYQTSSQARDAGEVTQKKCRQWSVSRSVFFNRWILADLCQQQELSLIPSWRLKLMSSNPAYDSFPARRQNKSWRLTPNVLEAGPKPPKSTGRLQTGPQNLAQAFTTA